MGRYRGSLELLALVLALLHAQWLGQWHRVAHAAPVQIVGVTATDHTLFGHDPGGAPECRLFDQIGSAEGLVSAPLAWADAALPSPACHEHAGQLHGRPLRPYQARAPPRG